MKKELRVLILEDVTADVVLINHELRKGGLSFKSRRVDTKDGFLKELQHHQPDIILSDHGLPSFDGFTALAIARDRCPDVPFIFVTGTLGEEMAVETLKSGASDYVLKSRISTNLVPAVQRALRASDERTRRKDAESALRESESRFRLLVEGVKDYAIFMLDTDGRVASWNAGAESIHGFKEGEILGRPFSSLFTPHDIEAGRPTRALRTAATEGRFEEQSLRAHKRGSPFWANTVITALRDTAGKLRGFSHVTRDVTERKAVEENLATLAAIVESSEDAILSMRLDGTVVSWNNAAERIFGYPASEIVGKNINMYIPPDRRAEEDQILAQLQRGERIQHYETVRMRKDGTQVHVALAISPLKDAAGNVVGVSKIAHDITEWRRAEQKRLTLEARNTAILDHALDAIITMDQQGMVREWNPAAERLFGYHRAAALGRHLDEMIIPASLRERYRDSLSEYLMTGVGSLLGRPIELTLRRLDEVEFQAELSITRISDAGPPMYTSFIRDITERKRAVEELRKSEERYRMMVENVEDYAIYLLDPEGHVMTWNSGAERTEGYTAEEIIGQHVSRFFTPEDVETGKPHTALDVAARTGRFIEEGWRVRKGGAHFWATVVYTALRDADGVLTGFSKVSRDITKRKKAEDEVHRLNLELEDRVIERTAELEAANKELEAFSYSVSHDLRAPLRHINGFVEMLQSNSAESLGEEGRRTLQTIAESARQMGKLIDDLLSFSRMGRMEMHKTPVNLSELITAVQHDLRHDLQTRKITWEIGDMPEVWGDPPMLRQVLVNLISNAIKYTRPRPEARIQIGCTDSEKETIISIRDNGVGFDMKYAPTLFGVFRRLHRASDFEGTGIGLANVHRIISRHGGRTWAEGAVNKGATFYFSLPKMKGGNHVETQANTIG